MDERYRELLDFRNPMQTKDGKLEGGEETTFTPRQKLALIERVAASSYFSRSARLRDFLLYVGRESLKPGNHEIHEQEIGAAVFGRPQNYDRSQDNIVRVNATELRKRIDLYFSDEGFDEPVVVTIPRGSYVPVFRPRNIPPETPRLRTHAEEQPQAPSSKEAVPENDPAKKWKITAALLAIVCCVLLFFNLRKAQQGAPDQPTVNRFWAMFGNAQTDVVLADEAVSMSEEMIGRSMTLSDYLDRDYQRKFDDAKDVPEARKQDLKTIFTHNLVTFGAYHAAQQVASMRSVVPNMRLLHARFYEADSLKRNNLVLIGGKKANPWVHLFDDQLNFSLEYDDVHFQAFVANRTPKAGEQAEYRVVMERNALSSYSVISFLPNPSHTGNVLILAGADSDATAAAAEFLTSEKQLGGFLEKVHEKQIPYFEVLLKTYRLSGTSLNSELVAYRIHPR